MCSIRPKVSGHLAAPALLAVLAVLSLPRTSGATTAPPATASASTRPRFVVLVLVPELDWAHAPPILATLARASLSVRAAPARSGAVDGYLTIGKGARSGAPRGLGAGPVVPEAPGLALRAWDRLRAHDRGLHVAGRLGALGDALRAAGKRWALVYDGATASPAVAVAVAVAAADRDGVVPLARAGGAAQVRALLADGIDALLVQTTPGSLGDVLAATAGGCALIASPDTPERSRHLGVLAATRPCGFGSAGLTSPATRRPHLVALPDVTTTFLAMAGAHARSHVDGRVVRASGPVGVHDLVQQDRRTVAADHARVRLLWLVVMVHAVAALVATTWSRARLALAVFLLTVPAAGFLMMFTSWWRAGVAGGALAWGAIALVLTAVVFVVGRGRPPGALVPLVALGAALLVLVDAAAGGRLELDAPFGNSPVVAGRFYGLGNVGLGFVVAGLLVAAGAALDRWERRAVAPVTIALAVAVVLAGAPVFGAKVGAALTCVPAFAAFALAYRARRAGWATAVATAAATIGLVAAFAAVDLALPGRLQTDLARWLGGGAVMTLVAHKALAAAGNVTSPFGLVLVAALAALVVVRPRLEGRGTRAAGVGLLVAAVAGSLLNDSGIVVAAAVSAVAWPALVVIGTPA